MKTNIEKYLKNKPIDVEEPDEAMLWEGIRANLVKEKKIQPFLFWKITAVLLAIFSFSYIIYNETTKNNELKFALSQINEALGEREKAYQQMVSDKMDAAKTIHNSLNSENEVISDLFLELNELDMIYEEAMNDLAKHGYLEQIVNIIFDTYEKRIRTLEQIIRESQKIKTYENEEQKILL